MNLSERYLLVAANQDRLQHHVQPVQMDPLLAEAALAHARQMASRGGISHQFAGESGLAERAADSGAHFSLVTENVAEASNASLIHQLWMQSAGHRANLLDPQVDSVGIAVVSSHGMLYAVEDFAHKVERVPAFEQESRVAALLENAGLTILSDAADARETCRLSSGYAGRHQPWFVMRYTTATLTQIPEELSQRLATGKYRRATVGACSPPRESPFSSYSIAVLLYP